MDDMTAVMAEVNAKFGKEEISDGCARTIASMYHNGQTSIGYSFVSTGAISDASALWNDFTNDGHHYTYEASSAERKALDMLGTYLTSHGSRGPVAGWSNLWIR